VVKRRNGNGRRRGKLKHELTCNEREYGRIVRLCASALRADVNKVGRRAYYAHRGVLRLLPPGIYVDENGRKREVIGIVLGETDSGVERYLVLYIAILKNGERELQYRSLIEKTGWFRYLIDPETPRFTYIGTNYGN